jgi:hypothetical protein
MEFRVTDPSGKTADHNVEVQPEIWSLLSKATEIPVIAVPGRPDVAKLTYGQVKSGDAVGLSPTQKMLLFIAVGCFACSSSWPRCSVGAASTSTSTPRPARSPSSDTGKAAKPHRVPPRQHISARHRRKNV